MIASRPRIVPERDATNHELVLRVLQSSMRPMTAYEILNALRREGFHYPQTVYRAIKRLVDPGDIHRQESVNAYLTCNSHNHHHGPVAFAICRECGRVEELAGSALTRHLKANAKRCGFRTEAAMIELNGTCASCVKAEAAEH
jgi:Fur family transcriptional regulator, zinc uptake regulator